MNLKSRLGWYGCAPLLLLASSLQAAPVLKGPPTRALTDPKRNSALADLLVRYQRAAQWARDNPSEWAAKYAKAVGLDIKIAALAQSHLRRLPIPLDDKIVAAEQRLANLFSAADQIPEAPDFVKWVDRRFNSVLVGSST